MAHIGDRMLQTDKPEVLDYLMVGILPQGKHYNPLPFSEAYVLDLFFEEYQEKFDQEVWKKLTSEDQEKFLNNGVLLTADDRSEKEIEKSFRTGKSKARIRALPMIRAMHKKYAEKNNLAVINLGR